LPAENPIYFENLALSLEKDKKSFFHGVHKSTKMAVSEKGTAFFYTHG